MSDERDMLTACRAEAAGGFGAAVNLQSLFLDEPTSGVDPRTTTILALD